MRHNTRNNTLLLAGIFCAGIGQAYAAGDAAATSGYYTIQPNAGLTGYVHTFSWVAPDTDNNSAGVSYTDTRFVNPFGNGNANLDTIEGLGGNYVAPGGQLIKYAWAMGQPGDENNPANTATNVGYQDPMNYTEGAVGPTTATPKHDSVGNFTSLPSYYVASGVEGVTGVYGAAPDGSDALAAGAAGAIHQGIGFGVDTDGADDPTGTDDFGPIIAGFDAVLDATPTNTHPNTGYVRVEVPFGTAGNDFTTRFNTGTYTNNAAMEVVVTTTPEGTYNAKLAVSGDFDSDSDVDTSDIIHASGNYTGAAGTGSFYADGDVNADGDVDVSDIIAIAGNFTGASAGNITDTPGNADLIYDPVTGNLTIDADSGANITGFQLESSAAFNVANYNAPAGASLEEGTDSVLAYFVFSGGLSNADLGNVLATGLDQASLEALLATADYSAGLGNSGEFDLIIAVVPEPSSAAMLGLAVIGGLLRRRRS